MFKPSVEYSGESYAKFMQSLLSNLLGSVEYFNGDSKVHNPSNPGSPITTKSSELLTTVPSRAFSPRGFLWDEGFDLLVLINWDFDLALEILKSWISLIDDDGWVAREQILGPEASSKVPEKSLVQNREYANAPTLFLALEAIIDKVSGKSPYLGAQSIHFDMEKTRDFMRGVLPKLIRHYEWFRESQKGEPVKGFGSDREGFDVAGYRWRGQTEEHILPSGLDDYPRSQPPENSDLHVDAISWVAMMAGVLRKVTKFTRSVEARIFAQDREEASRSIELLHWSETSQAYCDTAVRDGHRTHVCHKGYVSILPFLLGHLDAQHPRLGAVLDLMRNEKELWSSYGLRSLSLSDELYSTGENYWRGPVWVNMNYLALVRLLVSDQRP